MPAKKQKFYACFIPETGKKLVTSIWPECEDLVKGVRGARYKSFDSRSEAEAWLKAGASYGPSKPGKKNPAKTASAIREAKAKLEKGIYFDAGTGRGDGVEISVTDERGRNLLDKILLPEQLNKYGKHLLDSRESTNNFGELLACRYALLIAIDSDIQKVFGDSKLVVDYWSKGFIKSKELPKETVKLALEVMRIREEFELAGGVLGRVSGDINPADLGFHR